MIDLIKEQADLLQNRLWDIARDCYGLDRTPETVARIRATFTAQIAEECREAGLHHLENEIGGDYEPVEGSLAIAFMCTSLVQKETDPGEALALLTAASEALGAIKIVGMLRVIGKAGPIDLEKLGEVGDSLLRGVLAKGHASALAKQRHAENYALAEEAIRFWREKISPNLSAQKAATELEKVVPLSHKKLAELVSAEKKKVSGVRRLELVRTT